MMGINPFAQETYRSQMCPRCKYKVECREGKNLPILLTVTSNGSSDDDYSICTRSLYYAPIPEDLTDTDTIDNSTGAGLAVNVGKKSEKEKYELYTGKAFTKIGKVKNRREEKAS